MTQHKVHVAAHWLKEEEDEKGPAVNHAIYCQEWEEVDDDSNDSYIYHCINSHGDKDPTPSIPDSQICALHYISLFLASEKSIITFHADGSAADYNDTRFDIKRALGLTNK